MKVVIPIIGVMAVTVQLIRFWPLDSENFLVPFVTGAVFYIACKVGWEMQRSRILQDGYRGWLNWCLRTLIGTAVFLTLSLTLLFFSHNNPICEETGDPFFGRCEKYSTMTTTVAAEVSFNVAAKANYPLLLALAFAVGSFTKRLEYAKSQNRVKQEIP